MHALSLLSLVLLAPGVLAREFSLRIVPSPALPNPALLPPSTHAVLSAAGAAASAHLTPAHELVFRNVSRGSYLVDVHCATHAFAPLRVDVWGDDDDGETEVGAWDTFRGNEWNNRGEAKRRFEVGSQADDGRVGFEIRAFAVKNHFMERPKFSALSILKNPMILIALFGGGMFFVMPYLIENMDPEMRAEFEASQKSSPMAALLGGAGSGGGPGSSGFDMAEFLSGAGASKNSNGGSESVAGSNDQKSGNGKNKAKKG